MCLLSRGWDIGRAEAPQPKINNELIKNKRINKSLKAQRLFKKISEDSLNPNMWEKKVLHLCKNRTHQACWSTHVQTHIHTLCYSTTGLLMEKTPVFVLDPRGHRVSVATSHRAEKRTALARPWVGLTKQHRGMCLVSKVMTSLNWPK